MFGFYFTGFIGPKCHVKPTFEDNIFTHLPQRVLVDGIGLVVAGEVIERAVCFLRVALEHAQPLPEASGPIVVLAYGLVLLLHGFISILVLREVHLGLGWVLSVRVEEFGTVNHVRRLRHCVFIRDFVIISLIHVHVIVILIIHVWVDHI